MKSMCPCHTVQTDPERTLMSIRDDDSVLKPSQPYWIELARELQSIAQAGLTYATDTFDIERYKRLREMAAEMISRCSGLPLEQAHGSLSMQEGYMTPKIDVRGAVIRDGRLLLVRERSDGGWCMPGGWADVGEAPSLCVEREIKEESGYLASAASIVGIYDNNNDYEPIEFYHSYKIVFLCDLNGGEATTSNETSDVGFFSPDELPPLSERRTSTRHIGDVFARYGDAGLATVFD